MKKILLFFAVTSVLLSNDIMEVSASVLDTLTIRIDQNVEFGKVAKGSTQNKAEGKYSVRGQQGNQVKITFEGLDNNTIDLKSNDNRILTAKYLGPKGFETNLNDSSFVSLPPLEFSLVVPQEIEQRDYLAEFKIIARYN